MLTSSFQAVILPFTLESRYWSDLGFLACNSTLCVVSGSQVCSSKLPIIGFFNMHFQMSGLFQPEMQRSDFLALIRLLSIQNWSPGRKEKADASGVAGAASGQARPADYPPGKPGG